MKICHVGDSITEGVNGEYTARYYLWHKLRAAGHDVDFVGERWGVSWGNPASFDFDLNHEGRFGWRIDQVTSEGFQDTTWNVWLEGLGSTIKRFQMDIALVFLGHNDIFQGEPLSQLITDMRAHVALLRQHNPNVTVFLAQPFSGGGGSYEKIHQWALAVPGLAAELNTAQSRVIPVDFWNTQCGSNTYDTTHPTDAGYRLMADVWFAALDPFLRGTPPTTTVPADGIYNLVARHSGLFLDAFGSNNGSAVGQWNGHTWADRINNGAFRRRDDALTETYSSLRPDTRLSCAGSQHFADPAFCMTVESRQTSVDGGKLGRST